MIGNFFFNKSNKRYIHHGCVHQLKINHLTYAPSIEMRDLSCEPAPITSDPLPLLLLTNFELETFECLTLVFKWDQVPFGYEPFDMIGNFVGDFFFFDGVI